METEIRTGRTCRHLRKEYFEQLGGPLWCVQCDGNVNVDGTVTPRARLASAPVARSFGARLDRFLGQPITISRRSPAVAGR